MSQTNADRPKPPIEMDIERIKGAIKQLATLAWEHSGQHLGPDGQWIGEQPPTDIGRLIAHPILTACRLAHAQLHGYLARTIGPAAANEITDRINAEIGIQFETREVAANPDQVRH